MSQHTLTEIGLFFAGLGAAVFVWGAVVMVVANRSYKGPTDGQHRNEKLAHLVGAILLAAGFGLQLAAQVVK